MARSHGVIKVGIWDASNDFRLLTKDAQRMYFVLFSQPQINNLGVLPFTPRRWSRFAADDTEADTRASLEELRRGRFVVIDEDAGELWIRTFIKHDRVAAQPNLLRAAWRELGEIESDHIRRAVQQLYAPVLGPRVIHTDADQIARQVRANQLSVVVSEPLPEHLPEGLGEPLGEGVRVGAPVRAKGEGEGVGGPQQQKTKDLEAVDQGAEQEQENLHHHEPAAAEPAPPEPIPAILERLVPNDHDTLLDLAHQLPAADVRHIAAKMEKRRSTISDLGGYLRAELERKLRQHDKLNAAERHERTLAMIETSNGQVRAERQATLDAIHADPDQWAATEGAAMNDPGFEIQLARLFPDEGVRIRLRDVRATALRKDTT